MKRSKKNSFFLFFLLILGIFCLQFNSCYTPKTGCLDANATNFDVTADETCCTDQTSKDCCCTYPNLVLQTSFLAGTKNFRIDSIYKNDIGKSFKITKLKFYISNLTLIGIDGKSYITTDTISLDTTSLNPISSKKQLFTNNFALINPSESFSYTIGAFNFPKSFKSIEFTIGLDEKANKIIPTTTYNKSRLSSNPLKVQTDTLWDASKRYVFNKIWINKKPISIYKSMKITKNFPKTYTLKNGFEAAVSMKIDFAQWFKDVDFTKNSEATIIDKILANMEASITLN